MLNDLVQIDGSAGVPLPTPTPTRPPPSFAALTWSGADGSHWDLMDPASPVRLMRGGLDGVDSLPVQHQSTPLAGALGSAWHGWTAASRTITMKLLVRDTDADGWQRWKRSISPSSTGTLTIDSTGHDARTIELRQTGDGHNFVRNPRHAGYVITVQELIAHQPLWRGAPLRKTWSPTTLSGSWLPNPARRDTWQIGSATVLGATTVVNGGDVPTTPIWRVVGPTTHVRVAHGDKVIEGDVVLATGEWLVLDPGGWMGAYGADGDLTDLFDDWAAIVLPPKQGTQLDLGLTGGGSITMETTPLFERGIV